MQQWPDTTQTLLLSALALPAAHAADDLSDFSNNLATDIGPLLVLFGDSMTKQYLSESTSFLDYFIFAMAPIGIVTSIVSAIRVCGHSSLRAFVGRSQEGEGAIEAELCTSTSRDVCELFNRGGITRVLGRPNILELVYLPPAPGAREAQLHLFRHYLEEETNPETSEWQKVGKGGKGSRAFAHNPNLSLNIGIKKRDDWVLYGVATIGFILQAGVLTLASVGVWILHWNLNGSGSSASRDYAPAMFILGTVLMCTGMWSCAALIGQTTHELRYKREGGNPSKRSRLIWLQPGPQVIGDQSFDSFAYFEDTEKDPLRVWTSSSKDFVDFELYTFLAVVAVLVGYVMQFIGLRGMKAWVSLAHLAITVVMSVLRGCLRMQRLSKNDNKLKDMPELIAGYELDWLSFEIIRQESNLKTPLWHITGQAEAPFGGADVRGSSSKGHSGSPEPRRLSPEKEAVDQSDTVTGWSENPFRAAKKRGSNSRQSSESCVASSLQGLAAQETEAQPVPASEPHCAANTPYDSTRALDFENLLLIRERLAYLTGHTGYDGPKHLDERQYQKWKDSYVKVRAKAAQLSTAICRAAQDISRRPPQNDITLRIHAAAAPASGQEPPQQQQIDIILKPPSRKASGAAWSIDSVRIEAILGLWVWMIVSLGEEGDLSSSLAERVECSRVVLAGFDKDSNRQGEMDLWLGVNAVDFDEHTLTVERKGCYSVATLWALDGEGYRELVNDEKAPIRFCGWNSLSKLLTAAVSDSQSTSELGNDQVKLRVQVNPTTGSLLDICAQELFTSLAISLAGALGVEPTTTTENDGLMQLYNPTLATFAKEFVDGDLGSYSEALLCLVPASDGIFTPKDMLSVAIKAAEAHRKASEWDRAEVILNWACEKYAEESFALARALRALGEIYRWSLVSWLERDSHDEMKRFAEKGIERMKKYGGDEAGQEVWDVLDVYGALQARFSEGTARRDLPTDDRAVHARSLVQALRDRNELEALYHLCFITTGDFGSRDLQPAFPLAVRNDWREVVDAILEMKASPDCRDEGGRTAMSYCAELGYEICAERLIDLGAFVDQPDHEGETPLLKAVRSKQIIVVQLLLRTKHVNVDARGKNDETPLLIAAREGLEDIVKALVNTGADKEAKDSSGLTPLHEAAVQGHEAVAKLLIDAGANKEPENSRKLTPLHEAAGRGHEGVTRLLIEAGADKQGKHPKGWTPLHEAVAGCHEAVARLLIDAGADKEAMGQDSWMPRDRTPRDVAEQLGWNFMVRLFE